MGEYFVSPAGNDANAGTSPDTALRSLTQAISLIAQAYVDRGNLAVPESVYLEPGLYARESGEVFPLLIPPLTTVQGSGADTCHIEYSPPEGPFACGYSDTCIELHGTLADVSVSAAFPPDVSFPVIKVRLMDEYAVLERAEADLLWVDAATRVSQVDFDGALFTQDGFDRDGEVYPHVEDCHFTHTGSWNYGMGFQLRGGRVERCTGTVFWINSPGRTVVQNNTIDGVVRLFVVHRPIVEAAATSQALTPQIRNNTFESAAVLGDRDLNLSANAIVVFGESHWEGNTLYTRRLSVGCTATFVDNLLGALRVDITWPGPFMYDALGPQSELRPNGPTFRNNTFEQVPRNIHIRTGDEPEMGSFLTVSGGASPVFVANAIRINDEQTDRVTPVLVQQFIFPPEAPPPPPELVIGLPNPDFGGGGSSTGGNTFHVALRSVPHIKIDMGAETFHLQAQNNIWSYEPNIEVLGEGAGVSYSVDGSTLEA